MYDWRFTDKSYVYETPNYKVCIFDEFFTQRYEATAGRGFFLEAIAKPIDFIFLLNVRLNELLPSWIDNIISSWQNMEKKSEFVVIKDL